ncbi:hypothetical protein JMJ77_0005841, partial [Colletotrichum scovillei]
MSTPVAATRTQRHDTTVRECVRSAGTKPYCEHGG